MFFAWLVESYAQIQVEARNESALFISSCAREKQAFSTGEAKGPRLIRCSITEGRYSRDRRAQQWFWPTQSVILTSHKTRPKRRLLGCRIKAPIMLASFRPDLSVGREQRVRGSSPFKAVFHRGTIKLSKKQKQ